MSAEKKMIVGRTENAKYAPVFAHVSTVCNTAISEGPPAAGSPTGTLLRTRLPKMKRAPSSVNASN